MVYVISLYILYHMTINLNFFKMKQSGIVGFMPTKPDLSKHKITINQPKQTHFSVQGVQSYAPEQLRALKTKQDKFYQNKQGTFIKPTVVLLSNQIIEQQDEKTIPKSKIEQKIDRPKTGKKEGVKRNVRNSTSMNNQQIIKLQKERANKDFLRRKLQKLMKLSKKHFQGVSLKQNLEKAPAQQQNNKDERQDEDDVPDKSNIEGQEMEIVQKTQKNTNKNTNDKSSKVNIGQNSNDFEEVDWNSKGINLVNKVLTKSTYSERLGSAINNLFG